MSSLEIEISWGRVTAYPITQASAGTLVTGGPAKLCGWSLRETTGAAIASCEFSSGQTILGEAGMPAGASDTEYFTADGVYCPQGVTVSAVAGSFTGCVYLAVMQA